MINDVRPEVDALVRLTGVPIHPESLSDINEGWKQLQPLLARIWLEQCDFESEPATLFRADAFDIES